MSLLSQLVALTAKIILFFSGISFFINSIRLTRLALRMAMTKLVYNGQDHEVNLELSAKYNLYSFAMIFFGTYLIAVAVYAIYVSIFSPKQSIKRLAYVGAFSFFICVLVSTSTTTNLEQLDLNIQMKLKEDLAQYDWNVGHGKSSEAEQRATAVWDLVQGNLDCCGFESPNDWAPFRPVALKDKDVYPTSCCVYPLEASIVDGGYCQANMPHYISGCSGELRRVVEFVAWMMGLTAYYSLIFALLACLLLISSPEEPNGTILGYSINPNDRFNNNVHFSTGYTVISASGERSRLYPHLPPTYAESNNRKYGSNY